MRRDLLIKFLFILALIAIVYFVMNPAERSHKQDPAAARLRESLDSLHLKPGDTVRFNYVDSAYQISPAK